MTTPLAAKVALEFGTPALVIDMDRVERNIARIQAACDAAGVANRPHIKTHKSPMLARMQIAAGARGITCQKLGEAEVMANAGIDDILISYNLIGEEKMARLGALQTKAHMTVAVDVTHADRIWVVCPIDWVLAPRTGAGSRVGKRVDRGIARLD